MKKAGIPYKVPYTMRHTFAAWSLTLPMDLNRLVRLMGHGSKRMVYEVYGNYVESLEKDAGKIFDYFGDDFTGSNLFSSLSICIAMHAGKKGTMNLLPVPTAGVMPTKQ